MPGLVAPTYLKTNNVDPKPSVWVATTDSILRKVRRGRLPLEAITNQELITALSG